MLENKYYVYAYVDENNIPFYIGKGCGKRKLYHLYDSQNKTTGRVYNKLKCNKINKLISMIGYDNFVKNNIIILFDNLTEQESLIKESEIIKLHGRINNNTGILSNMTDGGEFSVGSLLKTQEHKDKISNSLIGHKRSVESRKKQSESQIGSKNHMFGIKRSDDVKEAISIKNSIPIIFREKEYKSISECAKVFGVSRTTVSRWINNECY